MATVQCLVWCGNEVKGFIYKPVTSPLVAVEEYFVRRELFVANVAARHLRWHEGGLWPT